MVGFRAFKNWQICSTKALTSTGVVGTLGLFFLGGRVGFLNSSLTTTASLLTLDTMSGTADGNNSGDARVRTDFCVVVVDAIPLTSERES